MLRCPTCAADLDRASRFCPVCGSALGGPALDEAATLLATPPTPSPPPSRHAPLSSAVWLSSDSSGDGDAFPPGTLLGGRFRIIGRLGRGGMGDVFRADDLLLGQPVALKFLPRDLAANPDRQSRFFGEVRIARAVSHPNVCRVYDVGEIDGQPYMSMELVDGDDLASLLRRIGRLPEDKALEVARQLCAGLAAAHEKGVLHRDLKPANVLIDAQGKVRITDFGLAVLAEEFTPEQARAGTPAYMAPEQISHNEVSVQSDVYSLGVVLYEIFTGKRAFRGDTLLEVQRLHAESMPPSPSTILEDIDPVIERAILRCLEKDPRERPASALAVAASLPGGDPLAAALAAGEMPSPELVAAAGGAGGLRPAAAWGLLAATALGLLVLLGLTGRTQLLRRGSLPKPPAVLEDRARDLLRQAGYTEPFDDHASGFGHDRDYLRWLQDRDRGPDRWRDLEDGRPGAIRFWYRQSPRWMESRDYRDGPGVSYFDPPMQLSGMASVVLDPLGRLTTLHVVPPQHDSTSTAAAPSPDWAPLFAAAGLDPARFHPVDPAWVPLEYSDARVAWEGTDPAFGDHTLRVEAGAYRGRANYFEIVGPWTRPGRMQPRTQTTGEKVAQAVVGLLLFALLIGSTFLARRNLQSGHGDRRGASRFAAYIGGFIVLAWALIENHAPSVIDEWQLFVPYVGMALFLGGLFWVLYVALEPFVRRRWPDSLIAWNRLLGGRWRDPRVGRDVLVGLACGVGIVLLMQLLVLVPAWVGKPPAQPRIVDLDTLRGLRWGLAGFLGQQLDGLFSPMILLFLLAMLRQLFRRQAIAVAFLMVLFTLISTAPADEHVVTAVIVALIVGTMLFLLLRFGLLALMAGNFGYVLLGSFPLTSDASAWYAPATAFAVGVVLVVAVYGCRTALAGRRAVRPKLAAA